MRYISAFLLLLLAVMASSCGKKKPPTDGYMPTKLLEIISGNNQTDAAGTFLADSFLVRITTGAGVPIEGERVQFTQITPEDNSDQVMWPDIYTNANGYGRTFYRLDTLVGIDSIEVFASGTDDSIQYFVVNSVPGDAVGITMVSGNSQNTAAGEMLPEPIVVRASDRYGNGVAGHNVSFKAFDRCLVITDSSSLLIFETDSAFTYTDSNGLAYADWILTVNPLPGFGYPNSSTLRAFNPLGDSLVFNAWTTDPGTLEYYYGIRDIFEENCAACHPGMSTDYRLDFYHEAANGGNIIPGDSSAPLVDSANEFHFANTINIIEEDKVLRWMTTDNAAPGSSGLNNYNDQMKEIFNSSCVVCHGPPIFEATYDLRTFQSLRGNGIDPIPNAIPGDSASLIVLKMAERHNWNSIDLDSVAAAVVADSIIRWVVYDRLRQY
jgi:hypothetical protein